MGANFAKLRQLLGERAGRDVHLISVSVDPRTDTPERLKAWAGRFGSGPGWTLVTGEPAEVTRLLKALGSYTSDIRDHLPLVLVGNATQGEWTRAYGLTPPAKIAEILEAAAAAPAGTAVSTGTGGTLQEAAHRYFGDVPLVDQNGRTQRLYSDLLAGKSVVIDVMFTSCTGVCRHEPHLHPHPGLARRPAGPRHPPDLDLGRSGDRHPGEARRVRRPFQGEAGLVFPDRLEGERGGGPAEARAEGRQPGKPPEPLPHRQRPHRPVEEAFGLAKPEEIVPIVDSVVNDRG